MKPGVRTMPMQTSQDVPARPSRALLCRCLAAAIVAALGGCARGDGVGAIFVDPGRYTSYHCKDMVVRWSFLNTREQQLRDLIARAREGTGGAVIGTLAYRQEYEQVLAEKNLLRRTAIDKKCDLQPASMYQSDDVIR
jgi:hypothetical protein